MVFAGAVILPSGAMIFDGNKDSKKKEVKMRRKNMAPEALEATERVRSSA